MYTLKVHINHGNIHPTSSSATFSAMAASCLVLSSSAKSWLKRSDIAFLVTRSYVLQISRVMPLPIGIGIGFSIGAARMVA